jgi:hypothetical protein
VITIFCSVSTGGGVGFVDFFEQEVINNVEVRQKIIDKSFI